VDGRLETRRGGGEEPEANPLRQLGLEGGGEGRGEEAAARREMRDDLVRSENRLEFRSCSGARCAVRGRKGAEEEKKGEGNRNATGAHGCTFAATAVQSLLLLANSLERERENVRTFSWGDPDPWYLCLLVYFKLLPLLHFPKLVQCPPSLK
jgi:hypothetical protein